MVAALAALTVALTTILYFVAGAFVSATVAPLFAGLVVIAVLGVLAIRAVRRDTLRLRASEQWGRKLRGELVSQAAFLDALVESLGAVSEPARHRACSSAPPSRPRPCSTPRPW